MTSTKFNDKLYQNMRTILEEIRFKRARIAGRVIRMNMNRNIDEFGRQWGGQEERHEASWLLNLVRTGLRWGSGLDERRTREISTHQPICLSSSIEKGIQEQDRDAPIV